MICSADQKVQRLVQFLLENRQRKTIVFFLTCAVVDYFAKVLPELECCKELNIVGMHGKQLMKKRTANFKKFSSHPNGVLLCTDVAARGIDIPDVDCIVQFDPPQDPDMFVHRIGRTARMNRTGMAVVFLLPKEDT
jgi:ATP-dependent RNA helicase DDX55/SPB4